MIDLDRPVVMEPGWEDALAECPAHLREGIRRYLFDHIRPGHFLSAVIRNDLTGAVGLMHPTMRAAELKEVVAFFYNFAPSPSWGSREKFDAWVMSDPWVMSDE